MTNKESNQNKPKKSSESKARSKKLQHALRKNLARRKETRLIDISTKL